MERPEQCPFIDRVDHRCSSMFSLDRLEHAFDYCFDHFRTCPLFLEMMAERRSRRMLSLPAGQDGMKSPGGRGQVWVASNNSEAAHGVSRFIQVRVARATRLPAGAYAQPEPGRALVPAASRV